MEAVPYGRFIHFKFLIFYFSLILYKNVLGKST